jgi:DNA primase
MSHAIDFTELKQRVSIERAVEMLGIKLAKSGPQLRGPCPICKVGGDRAFVVTPSKGLYYCFGACAKGGDAITMAANVRNCSLREAAEFLAGKGGANSTPAKGDGSRNGSPQPMTEKGIEAARLPASLPRGRAGFGRVAGDVRALRHGLRSEGHHARPVRDPDPWS